MIRKRHWQRETEPNKIKLDTFCCLSLESGAKIIAALHLVVTAVTSASLLTGIVVSYGQESI
jgi:hypothetical protein